jgi:uncharacterized protein YaaN involved in tellurite resistance
MEKSLTAEDQRRIEEFKKEINLDRPELLVQYGVSIQKNLSKLSEEMLAHVRNRDTSEVGNYLNEMMLAVKGLNVESMTNPNLFTKVWNKIMSELSLFKGGFEKVTDQLDYMIVKLEASKEELLSDVRKLDKTFEENLTYHHDLELLIQAAEEYISTAGQQVNSAHSVIKEDDYVSIQKLKDQKSALTQFEKRIHDLKLTKTLTLHVLPQIRLIQHNNNELVNKIQSSILHTVPVWKNQIVLALAIQRQKQVAEVQKKISDTTNELITKNSEVLKETTLNVATLSEQGIIDTEALKKVNEDLIGTIGGMLQIYQEGREKRNLAEKELLEMERKLKATIAGN